MLSNSFLCLDCEAHSEDSPTPLLKIRDPSSFNSLHLHYQNI